MQRYNCLTKYYCKKNPAIQVPLDLLNGLGGYVIYINFVDIFHSFLLTWRWEDLTWCKGSRKTLSFPFPPTPGCRSACWGPEGCKPGRDFSTFMYNFFCLGQKVSLSSLIYNATTELNLIYPRCTLQIGSSHNLQSASPVIAHLRNTSERTSHFSAKSKNSCFVHTVYRL